MCKDLRNFLKFLTWSASFQKVFNIIIVIKGREYYNTSIPY